MMEVSPMKYTVDGQRDKTATQTSPEEQQRLAAIAHEGNDGEMNSEVAAIAQVSSTKNCISASEEVHFQDANDKVCGTSDEGIPERAQDDHTYTLTTEVSVNIRESELRQDQPEHSAEKLSPNRGPSTDEGSDTELEEGTSSNVIYQTSSVSPDHISLRMTTSSTQLGSTVMRFSDADGRQPAYTGPSEDRGAASLADGDPEKTVDTSDQIANILGDPGEEMDVTSASQDADQMVVSADTDVKQATDPSVMRAFESARSMSLSKRRAYEVDEEEQVPLIQQPSKDVFTSGIGVGARQEELRERIKYLQDEIEKEESVERQASQALEVCLARGSRGTEEELEAERLLLISGIKISRCHAEIEQLRAHIVAADDNNEVDTVSVLSEGSAFSLKDFKPTNTKPCTASITLSELCLPLHLGYLSSLGRDSVGHFVIVARAGADIVTATRVKSAKQAANLSNGIVFEESLTLSPMHFDSDIDIEVYYLNINAKGKSFDGDSSTPTGTPSKRRRLGLADGPLGRLTPKKRKLTSESSFPRSPGVLSSVSQMTAIQGNLTTRFTLIGSAHLSLATVQRHVQLKMQEHELPKSPPSMRFSPRRSAKRKWSGQQILFGHIFATVVGEPHLQTDSHSGFLTWREEVTGKPNWHRLWCELKGPLMKAWNYPADMNFVEPERQVDIEGLIHQMYSVSVEVASFLVCVRKNTLVLNSTPPRMTRRRKQQGLEEVNAIQYLFHADSKAECIGWINALHRAIHNIEVWKQLPRVGDTSSFRQTSFTKRSSRSTSV